MNNSNASVKKGGNNRNTNAGETGNTGLQGNVKSVETGRKVPLDVNKPEFQDKLFELNWYLGIANPVFKPVKKNINVMGSDGKLVSKEIEKREFSHYEYSNVNGLSLENWIKNTFGNEYELDKITNQVYTLEAEQPQPISETEETQPQNNPEVNPNDPENN